jgi:hypothetical protein
MPSIRRWTWRGKAATAALGAVAGFMVLGGTAAAAPALSTPAPGTNLIVNGNFAKPSAAKHEGANPKDWTLVNLGAETMPYDAALGVYNAKGKYPPPKGNPNKSDVACEVFYEAGTATGVEGIGGQQTSATFKSITQANNPQVSFSNVETSAPVTTVAAWAGNGLQVNFTSGGKSYSLIYLSPWTAPVGTYSSKPVNSATTKYILGPTLTADTWYTWKARSLSSDIKKQFKVSSYTVSSVTFVNLEDTTNNGGSSGPYPNETGYVADVSIAEGS